MVCGLLRSASASSSVDFLRTTRRDVSVKFYVSATVFQSGWVKIEHRFAELSNPVTDFGENVNWDIFHKHTNVPASGMPAHWQRILFYPDGVPPDVQGSGPPPRWCCGTGLAGCRRFRRRGRFGCKSDFRCCDRGLLSSGCAGTFPVDTRTRATAGGSA